MKDTQTEHSRSRRIAFIRRLWLGELPLANVFWNWAVLGGLIVNLITSSMFLFLMLADQAVAAVICGYLVSLPYNFIVTIGVLRAADRYEGDRQWAVLARLATVAGMLLLSLT